MMINVYIVSGFLGAGKTTFIQKLLKEKKFEKVMLLENEFGEIGVDGAFFEDTLKVKEINNGCICCSLQGDFEDALEEIEDMGGGGGGNDRGWRDLKDEDRDKYRFRFKFNRSGGRSSHYTRR